jgi:hypothetical protein
MPFPRSDKALIIEQLGNSEGIACGRDCPLLGIARANTDSSAVVLSLLNRPIHVVCGEPSIRAIGVHGVLCKSSQR